jgi:hypothetical protein
MNHTKEVVECITTTMKELMKIETFGRGESRNLLK